MTTSEQIVDALLEADELDPKDFLDQGFDWRELLSRYGFEPSRCARTCEAMARDFQTEYPTKLVVVGEKRDTTADNLKVMFFQKEPGSSRFSLNAEQNVDILQLEALIKNYLHFLKENMDSYEGVPDWDEFMTKALRDEKSPEARQYRLQNRPPKSAAEARHMGVNWYIKAGRKYTFSRAEARPAMFQNSRTMATNRNIRRKSFGYSDTYSMRERGWPTAYRRPDGSEIKKRAVPEPPLKYEI